MNSLPRSNPNDEHVDAAGILSFAESARQLGDIHSFMLVRHGFVVAENWWAPRGPETRDELWSLSKSFTSTAVGFAVSEGMFAVTDRVVDLLPDEAPATPDERLSRLLVQHLLTMTTGHAAESLPEDERLTEPRWAQHILSEPLEFEPGSHFQYNSGATYLLSAIVQRLSGKPLLEYLEPRLFAPLGITSPTWRSSPQGVNCGGWGLSARTEDVAKLGLLYLQGGVWEGAQLLPADWVRSATGRQVSNGDPNEPNDWTQGYGYQFWQCRHGAFRGDGKLGQFCIVMPEQDAVLAITSDLEDMPAELDLVWEHILPALHH